MHPLDGFFVYRIDFLPEIYRGCSCQRSSRIDVTRDLENARPDCREDRRHDLDHPVIERMDRAGRFGFADAARYQRLDIARLDLHVHYRPVADGVERLGQGRNARPVSKQELLELRSGELSDRLVRRPLRMPGMNDWIVVNDHNPVASRVHVELYPVGSELDGMLKSGDRVLGMGLVGPPVGDPLGQDAAWTRGQSFLRVVALCSMSAKL